MRYADVERYDVMKSFIIVLLTIENSVEKLYFIFFRTWILRALKVLGTGFRGITGIPNRYATANNYIFKNKQRQSVNMMHTLV